VEKRMSKLDRAMATLNEKRIPYYETAAELAMDKKNPTKKQAYADAIGELRTAFEAVLVARGESMAMRVRQTPPSYPRAAREVSGSIN